MEKFDLFQAPSITLNNWHENSRAFFNWLEERGCSVKWGECDTYGGVEAERSPEFCRLLEKFTEQL